MNFSFFRKSGNEEAERTTDSTVVDHKLLFGVGEAHDLRHRRVHYQVYSVDRQRIDLTRPYSQKSFFRSKHISIPHRQDQLPTIYHQPFGTMLTIFLEKERHKNDDGSLPTHGQGTGKIRVFAHGSESRRFSHCHTVSFRK